MGIEPPETSSRRLDAVVLLPVALTVAAPDLAADLAARELRRVHVRVGDAGPDRLLHRRQIAGIVALGNGPNDVRGRDRAADAARSRRRTRRLSSAAAEEHRHAAVDVALAHVD